MTTAEVVNLSVLCERDETASILPRRHVGLLVITLACLRLTAIPTAAAVPRCQLLPLRQDQVSFQIDGLETTRWHFDSHYPRPFFFPLLGPSGASLTRMGHPGAPDHDHHRSIWLAHADVDGVDFWSDTGTARVRQKHWYCYEDGDDAARMACALGWHDAQGRELAQQDLVAALIPLANGEHALELGLEIVRSDKEHVQYELHKREPIGERDDEPGA